MTDAGLKRRSLSPPDADEVSVPDELLRTLRFTQVVTVLQLLISCAGAAWLWDIVRPEQPTLQEWAQLGALLLPPLSFALVCRNLERERAGRYSETPIWALVLPFFLHLTSLLPWAIGDATLAEVLDLSTGLLLLTMCGSTLTLYWWVTHRQEAERFWGVACCMIGFPLGPLALTVAWFLDAR